MTNITNLHEEEGVKKLKDLVTEIGTCLFCTSLKTEYGNNCRPMGVQDVDYEGNIWFLSDLHSDKNVEIKQDRQVQLFFSDPNKNHFLVVNGDAEVMMDTNRKEELWTSSAKKWFKNGKDDPSISVIKVTTQSAYYWDTEGSKMVNFFKMLSSVVTGSNLEKGTQGTIKL